MKHLVSILLLILITSNTNSGERYELKSGADILKEWSYSMQNAVDYLLSNDLYLKDYAKIDSALTPVIKQKLDSVYLDKKYDFSLSKDELSTIIMVIAMSEGSSVTRRGIMPFKSKLFKNGRNPFGIQGRGQVVKTHEYIKGKKTYMYLGFRQYLSFNEALEDLLDLWENKRYRNLKEADDYIEFFYGMYNAGYFTSPVHHIYFFIPYYEKVINDRIQYNKLDRIKKEINEKKDR